MVLAPHAAERAHQRHVADHVDHLAVDGGRLVGEFVMQRLAGGGEAEHRDHDHAADRRERQRHRQADRRHESDRADGRGAGRQHVPDEHVLGREDRVGRRGHAARQHAGQAVCEIVRRMPGQVAKQVAAQIAGHAHERKAGDPAGEPPQDVVRGDQRHEQRERKPYGMRLAGARQRIDEIFHAVLSRDGTGDRCQHRRNDHAMRERAAPRIAENERIWTTGKTAELIHALRLSGKRFANATTSSHSLLRRRHETDALSGVSAGLVKRRVAAQWFRASREIVSLSCAR